MYIYIYIYMFIYTYVYLACTHTGARRRHVVHGQERAAQRFGRPLLSQVDSVDVGAIDLALEPLVWQTKGVPRS